MVSKQNKIKKAGFLALAATIGAAVGGALGVLFAPQSGKETREDIKKALNDTKKEIKEKANKIQDLTSDQYQKIVDEVVDQYEAIKSLGSKKIAKIKKGLYANYQKTQKTS
ncbi:hypothetical protein COT63_00505 [Candidatus Shapirobacteria bacterium CG09_land_8_20_14_0_10_38_17]|uniref:Gas vesicle protein n=1 Tax=Candidatus Shapirobacteria bacterium CG09_land_8_20_14_0_10_38_17 TaxID=1974884 RepID=A0A2H0WRM9_9BACT|nr:MAG: hypothetical protein COT63_00505 [Candidatus Shapirobacteria bacterium CG09_land_8_20_14_0_10_38_17]